jgi:hypothetical protein
MPNWMRVDHVGDGVTASAADTDDGDAGLQLGQLGAFKLQHVVSPG